MHDFNHSHTGVTEIISIPVNDFGTPTEEQCRYFVEQVTRHLERASAPNSTHYKGIAIHCHQGMGRTGTFLVRTIKLVFNTRRFLTNVD